MFQTKPGEVCTYKIIFISTKLKLLSLEKDFIFVLTSIVIYQKSLTKAHDLNLLPRIQMTNSNLFTIIIYVKLSIEKDH